MDGVVILFIDIFFFAWGGVVLSHLATTHFFVFSVKCYTFMLTALSAINPPPLTNEGHGWQRIQYCIEHYLLKA